MTSRPAAPDPQHDRHVAFPDLPSGDHGADPAQGLPPTAWAPRGQQPPPQYPPPTYPPSYRGPQRRRGHAGWWVLAAFFALPVIGYSGYSDEPAEVGVGPQVEWADPDWDGSVGDPGVTVLPGSDVAGVEPTDQPTFPVPPGTTTYRVELAGDEPTATLHLVGAHGDMALPATDLPAALEVNALEPESLERVEAYGVHLTDEVQCRVYVDEQLVAISTGSGMAECTLPPPP